MAKQNGLIIDMTIDGNIKSPARPTLGTILARLAAFGIGLFVIGIAFWTALFMLPVILVLGVVAYLTVKSQMRRNGGMVFTRRF